MGRPRKGAFDQETSDRILRAAEEAFGILGVDRARLEDIAEKAGIRRPSLLYHFRSKQELYDRVVDRAFSELREVTLNAFGRGTTFEGRLRSTVEAMTSFASDRRALLALILRELTDPTAADRDLVAHYLAPLLDALEGFVREASDLAPSFPVRPALLALVMPYLVRAAAGPTGDPLWRGEPDQTLALARLLFLQSPEDPRP